MNPLVNRPSSGGQSGREIATALARWYAVQSSVRRLWAIEDPEALVVLVALEPTSDGDDTLPVWLARSDGWASDLKQLTRREVQLKLVSSAPLQETDAAFIAEVNWRDA